MQIPLNQFEQYIDETIFKRGLSYFKNGLVHEPVEISPGEYEAIVEGSEDYLVKLTIKGGIITDFECDCPYDFGPICKHVTAVIFHLQQDEIELPKVSKSKTKATAKKPTKRKTILEQVKDLLSNISHDDLNNFILDKAKSDPAFRNSFLASFADQNADESKDGYTKQIKAMLKAAAGRHDYIDWSASRTLGKAVEELLRAAERQAVKKNQESAMYICFAVMEEMTEAINYSDDSNGDIGGCIDSAYTILTDIANNPISESVRLILLDFCISSIEKRIFSYWDWEFGLANLAVLLINKKEEAEILITFLDRFTKSDYESEQAQTIKYELILKLEGKTEAEKFIESNLQNSKFRRKYIEQLIKSKDYEKATRIGDDGVKYDMNDRPGLAKEWQEWLLKIAIIEKKSDKIVAIARLLFVGYNLNNHDYYQLMKSNTPTHQWNDYLEELIKELESQKSWQYEPLLAKIFIAEKWWSRLLALLKKHTSLENIETYEKHLSVDYADVLIEMYTERLEKFVDSYLGRNNYQTACRYLRRMKKLGGSIKVESMIVNFRHKYPQRRALIEELNKV